MLVNIYHQCYQELAQKLKQLQEIAATNSPDTTNLRQACLEVQEFFQQQVVSLDTVDVTGSDAAKVRSYQTEISKQLRILGMDVIFLQGARQPETVRTRQMQLSDRLKTLQGYCEVILQLIPPQPENS